MNSNEIMSNFDNTQLYKYTTCNYTTELMFIFNTVCVARLDPTIAKEPRLRKILNEKIWTETENLTEIILKRKSSKNVTGGLASIDFQAVYAFKAIHVLRLMKTA